MGEPLVVDHRDAVAGAVDHVEAVLALLGLGEPVGERDLRLPAELAQRFERPVAAVARHEQVEVLGRARDAGVRREGEGAAHQVRHAARVEARERRAVGRVGARGRRLLDRHHLVRRPDVCHVRRWSNGCASAAAGQEPRAATFFYEALGRICKAPAGASRRSAGSARTATPRRPTRPPTRSRCSGPSRRARRAGTCGSTRYGSSRPRAIASRIPSAPISTHCGSSLTRCISMRRASGS